MSDQDLTTEGHALLEAAGWDPTHDRLTLRDGALWLDRPNGSGDGLTEQLPPWAGCLGELIVWAVNSAPRLLDIVVELRKRLEGHEKSVDRLVRERDRARAQFGLLFDALAERDASFTTEQGRVVAVKVPTLDEQRARISELEAERPVLGHVLVTIVEGRESFIGLDHRRVGTVAEAIQSAGRSDLPRGVTLKLCELREVNDDV